MSGFIEFIERHRLCTKGQRILLAVSGGMDSMLMLQLFFDHRFEIGVAHCNFGLRGEASAADEALVESRCRQLAVPFFVRHFDTKYHARSKGWSVQMAARDLRYAWFSDLMEQEGYELTATAHHLNDNIETVLLNLVRGTGLAGLSGIPVRSGRIIRPMLGLSKKEIAAMAAAQAVPWREDASNESDAYDRNFIRHHIIPRLEQINPAVEETIARAIERWAGAHELVAHQLEYLSKRFVQKENHYIQISKEMFAHAEFVEYLVWEMTKRWGFNYSQACDIAKAMNGQPGRVFSSTTHRLSIDRAHLLIEETPAPLTQVLIEAGETFAELGPLRLNLAVNRDTSIGTGANEAALDFRKVRFPLTWRRWQPGDAFVPLGMHRQKKKLSDFFVDNKVSLPDKEVATVLESDGEIIWVVGHRIDDRYKLTEETDTVLHISMYTHF